MPRATMADLITRVRDLTNAQASDWTDDQVQGFLDRHRVETRYGLLEPVLQQGMPPMSLAGLSIYGGMLTFTDYVAPWGDWESDETLYSSTGGVLTVATNGADRNVGRWTLAAAHSPPVYIYGKTYDVAAAAADVLEAWASRYALAYDFGTDAGESFSRGQIAGAMRDQAKSLLRQARPTVQRWARPDVVG